MPKRTVLVPVKFAVAVECEYTEDGTLVGTESSFHPVHASVRPGDEDAWDACLEVPPVDKDGEPTEGWPDYLEAARQRLAMELSRPIFWQDDLEG